MKDLIVKQTMSSRDIADLTGRSHDNVLKSIRSMEGAWEKVCGVKFNVTYNEVSMPNGGNRKEPAS